MQKHLRIVRKHLHSCDFLIIRVFRCVDCIVLYCVVLCCARVNYRPNTE
jgi:hypothetical protein